MVLVENGVIICSLPGLLVHKCTTETFFFNVCVCVCQCVHLSLCPSLGKPGGGRMIMQSCV